jgi:uncharacterized protein
MRCLVVVLLSVFAFRPVSAQLPDVPRITARVTDQTGTLSSGEIGQLEEKLSRFEHETSTQIAILIMPSLGDESIEEYTIRVAEKNRFGKKGRDNGVLLVVAKEDRQLRIEVGYGLEGALPDAVADQIIRRVIVPEFRDDNYYRGLDAGIDAIIAATKGEFTGDGEPDSDRDGLLQIIPILLFILLFGFFRFLLMRRHYTVGRRGPGGRYGGTWYGGGFGGGGWGGGGFGGGGFSGGGGGFGGGGASGRW